MDRSLSLLSAVDVLYASVLSRYSINASVLIRELLLSATRFCLQLMFRFNTPHLLKLLQAYSKVIQSSSVVLLRVAVLVNTRSIPTVL